MERRPASEAWKQLTRRLGEWRRHVRAGTAVVEGWDRSIRADGAAEAGLHGFKSLRKNWRLRAKSLPAAPYSSSGTTAVVKTGSAEAQGSTRNSKMHVGSIIPPELQPCFIFLCAG